MPFNTKETWTIDAETIPLTVMAPGRNKRIMKIPNIDQGQKYFESLNFKIIKESVLDEDMNEEDRWLLLDSKNTAWGKEFSSFLDLWCWWLHFVALCLHEEQSAKIFIRKYSSAWKAQKREMKSWLDLYHNEETPQEMKDLLGSKKPITVDSLPKDWKKRIANQLQVRQGVFSFWNAVKDLH